MQTLYLATYALTPTYLSPTPNFTLYSTLSPLNLVSAHLPPLGILSTIFAHDLNPGARRAHPEARAVGHECPAQLLEAAREVAAGHAPLQRLLRGRRVAAGHLHARAA